MSEPGLQGSLREVGLALWRLLTSAEKRKCVFVMLVSTAAACLTLAAVAGIAPFFAVLTDPANGERSGLLRLLQRALVLDSMHGLLVWLGIGFVALLALANFANFVALLSIGRFSQNVGARLHALLFDEYLNRDLAFHARHNSSMLATRVVQDVSRTVGGVLQGGLTLLTSAVTIVLLAGAIVVVDPIVAAAAIALIGASYVLIHALTKRRLVRNGSVVSQHWQQRAQVVAESFAAIKDIAVHRVQHRATARVAHSSAAIAAAQSSTPAIATAPKYVLECVTGAGLVAAALAAHASGGASEWPAQVAFLAFSAYRLVPAVQQVFSGMARIHAERPAFDTIVDDLQSASRRARKSPAPRRNDWRGAPRRSLRLIDVTYRHARERPGGVSDVTLEIPAGALVGFVGQNGAGKSTLAEIALGLRVPQAGHVEVDGVELRDGNRDLWLETVAYVPQHLAFVDGTIAENIAFGAASNDIDLERVRDAASRAELDGFIRSLPDGLATVIGENGARLSGGQRQRLGLARALYRVPSLLIVDEATTALDALTEAQVLELLADLRGRCTIIVITHRPSTLRGCDLLFELGEGRLVATRRPAPARERAVQ